MAIFRDDTSEYQERDFMMLLNSPVSLYRARSVLNDDIRWLSERSYAVAQVDCRLWRSEKDVLHSLAVALEFPEYFGHNLNALSDCLGDLAIPPQGGRAVVFSRYDLVPKKLSGFAWRVLDIFARKSRIHLLYGRRLVMLVQSDDPALTVEPVGACAVGWNPAEWLSSARGL
jgi:hypothetical protein